MKNNTKVLREMAGLGIKAGKYRSKSEKKGMIPNLSVKRNIYYFE